MKAPIETFRTETWKYSGVTPTKYTPVIIEGDTVIAEMSCDNGNPPNPYTITLRDAQQKARLMAAAPELLQALHALVDALQDQSNKTARAVDLARKALAKATDPNSD